MKIYALSDLGIRVSKTTTGEASNNWQVLWAIKSLQPVTSDHLAMYTGLSENEVGAAIGILRRKGLIDEK